MTHETHHPAITLSRTLGSGGSLIAYHVAQQLGWRYLDRRILRRTAAELGLDLAAMGRGEERPDRFIDRLLQVMAVASPESPYTPPVEVPLYGRDIFEQEVPIMRDLLAGAPAVLVGRGGFVAFRHRPATLHVHVQASRDFRIQRLVAIGKAPDPAEALRLIQASDQDRTAFIREISGLAWEEPRNFDLIVDPSREGFELCEHRIIEAQAALNPLRTP